MTENTSQQGALDNEGPNLITEEAIETALNESLKTAVDLPLESPQDAAASVGADSLAAGVAVLLSLTVIQKGVGFTRGLLFCRWLTPYELGQWDLAFSFLMMAVPVAILGIPGSFGRYVEHFRQRGQFFGFFRQTLYIIVTLALAGAGIVLLGREHFSWLIFDSPGMTHLLVAIVGCMLAVTLYNYLIEIFFALRQTRVASCMEFSNSILFAIFSLALLYSYQCNALVLIVAYFGASLCTALWGLVIFRRSLKKETRDRKPLAARSLWSKLAPFAAWIWVTNLLANLFVVADRYMIMHFSGLNSTEAAETVGAYHSSRVMPWLLATVATMLSTVALPHLSRHWEADEKDEVSRKANLALKLGGFLLMGGAFCILLGGGFLFDVAFKGKYPVGHEVLPWTTTLCMWFGLTALTTMYLWCAEKARLSCIAIGIGLVLNIVLNYFLLPRFGLMGAVLATAAANYLVIVITLRLNKMVGMKVERGTWIIVTAPLGFGFGVWTALVTLAVLATLSIQTDWILTKEDKDKIRELARRGQGWITARMG